MPAAILRPAAALLAAGSNFPLPPSAGGKKTFYRTIYMRPLPLRAGDGWKSAGDLPGPRGEGASVTTEYGVVCLGGHDGAQPLRTVLVLRWDAATTLLERRTLADLPVASANAAAAYLGGFIYLMGGESPAGTLARGWRLDLRRTMETGQLAAWEELPAWPGRPRFGAVLVPVATAAGERLLFAGGLHGPARGEGDYLRDAFLYDPAGRRWTRAADLPHGAVLASAARVAPGAALVLGGSDGHDFARLRALGDRYRIPARVQAYDAMQDRWSLAGAMPLGLAGAALVALPGGWLVAGGEFSPGLRTARTDLLRVTRATTPR